MNDDENDAFGMDLPPDDAMPVEDAPNQSGMQLRPRSRVEQMAQKPPKVVGTFLMTLCDLNKTTRSCS